MKKIVLLVIMILMTIFFVFSEETVQREFKVSKGKKLEFDMKGRGNVSITGWEKESAAVTLHFKHTTPDRWSTRFKETAEGIEIEIDEKGKNANRETCLDVDVKVPVRFDLKLKIFGGDTSIVNLEGEMSGKTVGGNLRLSHLKGDIDIKAAGGDITVNNSRLSGKLRSIGGRVLFENVTGDVEGISVGGNVIHQNAGGDEGRSGGNVVKVSSMGGDININEARHGAEVQTVGGSIRIKSAAGDVKAVTTGGNIVINTTGGGVEASTAAGDITLTVPRDLSMDVDIELVITKDVKKKYDIVSDFPLNIERSDTPDTAHENRSGKCVYGKATIAGGKHKIRLKNVNGNIYLKKSK